MIAKKHIIIYVLIDPQTNLDEKEVLEQQNDHKKTIDTAEEIEHQIQQENQDKITEKLQQEDKGHIDFLQEIIINTTNN